MRRTLAFLAALSLPPGASAADAGNPQADYNGFTQNVQAVGEARLARRLTEEEFIRMAAEPGTVVLDARSERLFKLRHIAGAVNLSLPEFTAATLAGVIPTPGTRVLIYCNNNFVGLPESMPVKAITMPLNFSTHVSLHAYGYRNVYELEPAIEPGTSRLRFAGEEVRG